MKKQDLKWDDYFQTYFHIRSSQWSEKDVNKYANWYWGWLKFIQKKYHIIFNGKKALEIGSGAGGVCDLLNRQGAEVVGSDVSRMMINNAKRLIPEVPFVYCDIQKGVDHSKYDYIIGFEVLEHVRNPKLGIVNIYKALKPGGKFIGSSPYPFAKNLADPTHVNVKYPDEWKKLFIDSGFKNVVCQPLSFPPLLWRIHRSLNIALPFYISIPGFVSTTLLVAER
jgi:2-polyprenyl-3-methyl-5-hydroxy-6-metoxy-1,4-benzoquinol methylase